MVDEPRRRRATPGEHGVGDDRAATVAAQHGDEDVGAGRQPLAAATASHSASSTGQSATIGCQRAAAETGSSGRSSGVGRQQRRARRQRQSRRSAGRRPWWRRRRAGGPAESAAGRRRRCRRAGPAGRSGGSRRSVPSSPTVTSSSHVSATVLGHAALTKLGIGAGADVERAIVEEHGERHDAARRPLDGDGDRPAARRREQRGDGVAARRLGGDRAASRCRR